MFLEAVLAAETMQESLSDSEEKDNPNFINLLQKWIKHLQLCQSYTETLRYQSYT